MIFADPPVRPRAPAASGKLLSAALGGLLCLGTSCHSDTGSDSGTPADTGANADGTVPSDATMPGDTGNAVDVNPPLDALLDSVAAPDAYPDAQPDGFADDAFAIDAIPPCDIAPDRVITSTTDAAGTTLESFTASCDAAGGFVEIAPHCGGMNTCRGFSYDEGTGVMTEHNCAGLNTCQGFSCVLP